MKKLLLSVLLAAAGVVSGQAQGAFNFSNTVGGSDKPVTRATDGFLRGDDYTASLFWGLGNVSDANLLALYAPGGIPADISFVTQTGSGTPGTGLFSLGQVFMPPSVGTVITVQVRAWQTTAGSYANAVANGSYFRGVSNLVPLTLGTSQNPPDMVGLLPFTVAVPEPTTLLLGGIGALTLLLLGRRRK